MSDLQVPAFDPAHVIFLDFEAFFSKDYSLSKMTAAAYVRDPRWETLCVGVKIDGAESVLMEHEEFKQWASTWPWATTALGCHSSSIEPLVCAHHYGVFPGFWFDTMSMSRALGLEGNLRFLMEHYQVGEKGHELEAAKGKHRQDFTEAEWAAFGGYCLTDVDGCAAIFNKMADQGFPEVELYLIDATIRMFSEPQLCLDETMLREYMVEEKQRKTDLLERCGLTKKDVGSNDKIAAAFREFGVEPPRKISPTTKKEVYAFAKNDVGMLALLEHEVEEVRWLAEARIAVKSTINESRGGRFLELGKDGQKMSVQLNYFGAHTGRWSGAGKCNFQNLERTNKKNPKKGRLKKSLLAPLGHSVVAVDSGQIEARGVSWLAGHDEMTKAWAQNRDLYSEFASEVYQRHIDRKVNPADEIPGFVAKTCFAAGTLVLTEKRGYVDIVDVQTADRLWDGVEWVSHSGLMDQGEKEVWESYGISATPDHEILTERSWVAWSGVLKSSSLFQSALRSASSPSSNGDESGRLPASMRMSQSYDAHVDGRDSSIAQIYAAGELRGVTGAPKKRPIELVFKSFAKQCLTIFIEKGCSMFSPLASLVATILSARSTDTMAGEGFSFGNLGVQIGESFSASLLRSQAGTSKGLSWTGSTITAGMNQETFVSLLGPSTSKTNAKLGTCSNESLVSKRRTRVYDLLSVGPRHRFTVLSDRGPLIVSNCLLGLGYSQGGLKLGENFLKGTSGPPVQFTMTEVEALGVDLDKFFGDERKMKGVEKMLSRLSLEARAIHCAVADHLVKMYRTTNQPIPALWKMMGKVIGAMADGINGYFGPNDCLEVVDGGILLPNGITLHYPELRHHQGRGDGEEEDEEEAWRKRGYSYFDGQKRSRIYGGLLLENICQALARIVVAEQMLHVKAVTGYRPCLSTHDEWAYVAPTSDASALRDFVIQTMKIPPTWAKGWPLNAEGGFGRSYGEAK